MIYILSTFTSFHFLSFLSTASHCPTEGNTMDRNYSRMNPSFFQILTNKECTRKLRLPPDFTGKYGRILPENAKISISSGESWEVRIEQMEDEHYYFTKGWKKFVEDLELKIFELIVFWFDFSSSTFDVAVYGTTTSEKDYSFRGKNENENEKKSNPPNPCFEIVFQNYQSHRLGIDKHLAEACGLIGTKRVGLVCPGGRNFSAVVHLKSIEPYFRLDLAAGWHEFWKSNGFSFGKRYSFEFIPSRNVFVVKQIQGNK